MMIFLYCFIVGFLGYLIGRAGHIIDHGRWSGPDHWIYGALLFLPGIFFVNTWIFLMFAFGAGLIISDLKDFLNFKYWGPDKIEVFKFWHID